MIDILFNEHTQIMYVCKPEVRQGLTLSTASLVFSPFSKRGFHWLISQQVHVGI